MFYPFFLDNNYKTIVKGSESEEEIQHNTNGIYKLLGFHGILIDELFIFLSELVVYIYNYFRSTNYSLLFELIFDIILFYIL